MKPRSHSLSSCGEFEISRPDLRLICCMGSIFLNVCVLPFASQSPLVAAVYAAPSMPDMLRSRKLKSYGTFHPVWHDKHHFACLVCPIRASDFQPYRIANVQLPTRSACAVPSLGRFNGSNSSIY